MLHLKRFLPLTILLISTGSAFSQKIIEGNKAQQMINGSTMIRYVDQRTAPDFILLNKTMDLQFDRALPWVQDVLKMKSNESLELSRVEKDKLGMVHYIYQHKIEGIPVEFSQYRLHTLNGKVLSLNGEFYQNLSTNITPGIDQATSINSAKAFIGAQEYRWENQNEENFLRQVTGNPNATYAPQPELVIVPVDGNYQTPEFRLAWKMDIYATKPLSRNWVYVDAQTGAVIWTITRICHVDVPGTATTVHSGSRPIVADSFGGGYRLRESGRGLGIETYNLNDGTDYLAATDFTDADNNWGTPAMGIDQYALDAHWGAEMTYDYYWTIHNRNSIDDNGLALLSYVHYDVNYDNAFWDGTSMTYGDGDGSYFDEPLTAIEITGHEISHGLTEYTAGLVYQDEPGALNESFSDIFGVTIDNFARGTTGLNLWRMGEESTSNANGLRRMDNPGFFGDPDTYNAGTWYTGGADNGGVHTNSGVQNYWYYIMCQGATGTNDIGNAYNVTGIGMTDAADITFRSLTIYLGSNSQYADARFYSILAANDLFGGCSPEVITTTNAWYAVGVGPLFIASVNADFSPSTTSVCNSPAIIDFTNLSNNGVNYTWHFGDGGTSTLTNPSHTYASNGTYNVSLAVDGGTCGTDSIYYSALVTVNIPSAPAVSDVSYCDNPAVATLNGTGTGTLNWYASMGATTPLFSGNPYITSPLSTTTTFYVEDEVPNGSTFVGPVNNSFGTGGNHNNTSTQYLEFTVYQPITINTVDVVSGGAGSRNIEVWDGGGTPVTTITVNIPSGTNTVTLNLDLGPGTYRIGGTQMNLYRNNASASYPYTLPGFVDITGSSAGPTFYYYFYHWNVTTYCTSNRIPVTVTIAGPAASFNYNTSGTVVTFTNTSVGATGYFWDFGGGNTSTSANPSFDFGGFGTYPVMLVANNGGCSDTTYMNIVVGQTNGIEDLDFVSNLYPNPFTNTITLSMQLPASGKELVIDAYNAIGQKVQNIYKGVSVGGQYSYTWNVPEDLAPGLYFIRVTYDGKQIVKQAIKH